MLGAAVFLTDFADAGVMAPVALSVALTLLVFRQPRAALVWLLMTGSVWALMLALKFSFYLCANLSCALVPERLHLVSPSGHVAASAAIYGGLLGISLRSAGRSVLASCLAAIGIAMLVGLTRIVLDDHSLPEVIVGGCVGVAGAVLFARSAGLWLTGRRRAVLIGVVALSATIFHGTHMGWELQLRSASAGAAQLLSETW